MDTFKLFTVFYNALYKQFSKQNNSSKNNNIVISLLSDMSPYVWEGNVSGDPAFYEEFENEFKKQFNNKIPCDSELEDFLFFFANKIDNDGYYSNKDNIFTSILDECKKNNLLEQIKKIYQ